MEYILYVTSKREYCDVNRRIIKRGGEKIRKKEHLYDYVKERLLEII